LPPRPSSPLLLPPPPPSESRVPSSSALISSPAACAGKHTMGGGGLTAGLQGNATPRPAEWRRRALLPAAWTARRLIPPRPYLLLLLLSLLLALLVLPPRLTGQPLGIRPIDQLDARKHGVCRTFRRWAGCYKQPPAQRGAVAVLRTVPAAGGARAQSRAVRWRCSKRVATADAGF
jgi:hypothetical protein